jgi:hypothetical protein
MDISKLCTPAMIYFVISFIVLILTSFSNFNVMSLLIKLLFILFWSWILNYLCSSGLTIVSWILVILPFFGMMSF